MSYGELIEPVRRKHAFVAATDGWLVVCKSDAVRLAVSTTVV